MNKDKRKWMDLAIRAALDAGDAIMEIYARDFDVEFKEDNSPLTAADRASHDLIEKALARTPYPVLSEESGEVAYEERRQWDTYWLVDPLDGTKEFIKKNDEFTVNIALVENGRPAMGVVYAPVLDTLYCGERGQSAWKAKACKGKSVGEIRNSFTSLSISNFPQPTPSRALRIVASRSHCNEETTEFIETLEAEYGPAERVSRGSSLKLCMVAEGSADIYPRIAPTMEWDTAAAHAVVSAAGGKVFEYCGEVDATCYHSENNAVDEVAYNKENLLNPYFIVSGLHE